MTKPAMPCGHLISEAATLGLDDNGNRKYMCCGIPLTVFGNAEKMIDFQLRAAEQEARWTVILERAAQAFIPDPAVREKTKLTAIPEMLKWLADGEMTVKAPEES